MSTVSIEALVIRRSINTNSFGLRGIWIITTAARRVFEFACSDLDAQRYQIGEIVRVPFVIDANQHASHPAHELVQFKGDVPAVDVPQFLGLFNDTLADQWTAHKAAKAITEAAPRVKLTAQDNPDHSPLNAGNLRAIN